MLPDFDGYVDLYMERRLVSYLGATLDKVDLGFCDQLSDFSDFLNKLVPGLACSSVVASRIHSGEMPVTKTREISNSVPELPYKFLRLSLFAHEQADVAEKCRSNLLLDRFKATQSFRGRRDISAGPRCKRTPRCTGHPRRSRL